MCGIAGFINAYGAPADGVILRRMCDRLAHRGPDAYGEYLDGPVALGHRRLSIIDLEGGAQPLGNEDGSIQVAFNGEIYNYLELRKDLIARGHRFATRSDTEALVHLYEEEGERMAERLNGMFAFAIWDGRRRELLLGRDRLGKKPLYYSYSLPGVRICFGSELKALEAMPQFERKVCYRSVADFLSLSYIPDPETIYENVCKLEPGHTLTVGSGGARLRRYWTAPFEPGPAKDIGEAAEVLQALASDAVERRLMSDVPLGAFLSGGVDSSAAVAFMAQRAPERVKTFSIGFTTKAYDELEYARLVAGRYDTDHHEWTVTPSIGDVLSKLVEHFDEPFGDASAIPMLYLARMTRRHVTVALSGDGADELFGGYRRYRFGVIEERIRRRLPAWFRRTFVRLAGEWYPKLDFLPQVFRAKALLTNLAGEIADAYFNSITCLRDENLDAALSSTVKRGLAGYSPRERFRQRFETVKHLPPLEQMQAVDLRTYLPGDILVKTDRATMAYSLEARCPWLDYRLAELAGGIEASLKLRATAGKLVFKRAVEPLLPARILTRRKRGFSPPLAEWFRGNLGRRLVSLLASPDAGALLSVPRLRQIYREHASGLRDHSRVLWNALLLIEWQRRTQAGEAGGGD